MYCIFSSKDDDNCKWQRLIGAMGNHRLSSYLFLFVDIDNQLGKWDDVNGTCPK